MASNPSAGIRPTESGKETLIGMQLALEQRFGCQPRYDFATTLNTKFNVFPTQMPSQPRSIKYFAWGNQGRVNDNGNLSSAQYVSGTNMAPYGMCPFRAMPLENDISATERAKYGMRTIQLVNDVPYVFYYLKRIDFSESQVQFQKTDPVSGITEDYEIDPDNLNPVPPVSASNGVIEDVADTISVVLPGTVSITGIEALEVASVLFGGDTRYAVASELCFVSAAVEQVSALNAQDQSFNYQEAIYAQIVDHYTWTGHQFLHTSDTFNKTLMFSSTNVVTQN